MNEIQKLIDKTKLEVAINIINGLKVGDQGNDSAYVLITEITNRMAKLKDLLDPVLKTDGEQYYRF